ncbi:MAG TPA: hypothetical protein VFR97_04920 [Capillimicrobium sp.]|nr:hypothetical protein [Capillimicrobium sp.]
MSAQVRQRLDPLTGAAAGAGLVLLAVLAWRASDVIALVTANSDLAAPLVMGDVAHRYDDAQLVGRLGWWGGLWVVQLLRPLPGSEGLSTWLPFVATLAVAGLVAWQARALWGRLAGAVVLLVTLSAGAVTWVHLASWSARSPSWWAMGLAGVLAVAVARAADRPPVGRRRAALAAAAVLVALAIAMVASGDELAVAGAIVPLAAAGAFAASRRRLLLGALLGGGAVLTFGLALAIAQLAEAAGYLRQDYPLQLVAFTDLPLTVANLVLGVTRVWSDATTLGTLAGLLGLALVTAAVVAGARALWRAGAAPPAEAAPIAGGVWLAFWLTALVVLLAVFVPTTASGALGDPVVRYLHGVPLAAAAVLAACTGASPRARALPAAATVLALLTALSLAVDPPKPAPPGADVSRAEVFGEVERMAREEGVTRGFASYWTSYPLAIHAGRELDVTPIGRCGEELCPMYLHYVDQAYAEQPGIRSFVLVDTSPLAAGGHAGAWATVWPKRMKPVKVYDVGGGVQMGIFDHDAARDLVPNGGNDDPRAGHGGPLEPLS